MVTLGIEVKSSSPSNNRMNDPSDADALLYLALPKKRAGSLLK